jgi:hypothetical protein
MELIVTDEARKGSGKDAASPIRRVTQVYTKAGELVAEADSDGTYTIEDMVSFVSYLRANLDQVRDTMTDVSMAQGWASNTSRRNNTPSANLGD